VKSAGDTSARLTSESRIERVRPNSPCREQNTIGATAASGSAQAALSAFWPSGLTRRRSRAGVGDSAPSDGDPVLPAHCNHAAFDSSTGDQADQAVTAKESLVKGRSR